MSGVRWLPEALADVERLHDFLHRKNPQAAARAVRAILEGANALSGSPRSGRPMLDDTGRREWVVAFGAGAYVLRYRVDVDETPVMIRVWHSLEDRR